MTMYNLFLFLTIATIISQLTHTWFVFDSFRKIKQRWLKLTQSVIFCSILSVAILAFVLIEKPKLALLGAIVEIIINIYYYAIDFFENGIRHNEKHRRRKAILTFWRKNWIAIFFGILLPLLIYVFAEQMILLKI